MNLNNIYCLPFFESTTEIRNQHVLWVPPESWTVNSFQQQTPHLSNGCHQKLAVDAYGRNVVFQPVWVLQSPYHQIWDTPSSMTPILRVHIMTVDQTANWIRRFCLHWGWREAEGYAMTFRENNIDGSLLIYLNHEILKFDMGISNHFHRINLIAVIRQFFPCLNIYRVSNEPMRLSDLRNVDIKFGNRSKISATQMGNFPRADEKCSSLKNLPSDKDHSLEMNSNSIQNITFKSVSAKSDCDMEFSDGKSLRSRSHKPLSEFLNSEHKGKTANCILRRTYSPEKAKLETKSFEDVHELRIGKPCGTNYRIGNHKSLSPSGEYSAKLILTHNLNFVMIENIRDRFKIFNFFVAVELVDSHSCVLTFQSLMEAMRALNYQQQIGYKLNAYEEDRCLTQMSPVVSKSFLQDACSSAGSLCKKIQKPSEALVNRCGKSKAQHTRTHKTRNEGYASKMVRWVSLKSDEATSLLQKL